MNYILQLNGFWNWTRTNEISHLEVDLYLSILDIANTSSWKTCFTIPNSTLGRFDKNSLTRARNKLAQYGLITFNKGKKGQAPTYSVVPLYDKFVMSPNHDTDSDTNHDIVPINDTYIDTHSDTNSDTNMIPIQGTYLNVKENKTKQVKEKYKKKKFTPPTVDEVGLYCQERNNGVDAQRFCDFYNSKDWYVGKNKMKDWRAAVRTWEHNAKEHNSKLTADDSGLYSDNYDHELLERLTREKYNKGDD